MDQPSTMSIPVPGATAGWRSRVERGSDVMLGTLLALGGAVRGPAPVAPAAGEGISTGALVLGAALELRRVSLDAAERTGRIAGRVTRTVASVPPVRATTAAVASRLAPLAATGNAARLRLPAEARRVVTTAAPRVVDGALDLVDLNDVLAKVDLGGILERVDIDGIVSRVDIDGIVGQIDIDGIVGQIDIDGIVGRIDINAIVTRVDIDGIMQQTEMGSLIVKSTGGMATEALDLVRSQGVGLDTFVNRLVNRTLRRRLEELPEGPPLLVPPNGSTAEP